jgi:D-inositol-3-phosphate glycosyltransferase
VLDEPALLSQLSRGAVAHAREFSWKRTAAGLLAVYQEAVQSTMDFQLATLGHASW